MTLSKILVSAAVLWIALPAPARAAIQEAHISGGTVTAATNNGIASFKGIPFAAPPIGPLRWKPPQPVIPWVGIKRSDSFGPPCAQPPGSENHSAEDCLFLNVWTGATNTAERRPVMVWIHGGGFNRGATWSPTFDGSRFAEQGVVLFSVAYRLGVFGFLAHPELTKESDTHSCRRDAPLPLMEPFRVNGGVPLGWLPSQIWDPFFQPARINRPVARSPAQPAPPTTRRPALSGCRER
jgi:hypothetical protein